MGTVPTFLNKASALAALTFALGLLLPSQAEGATKFQISGTVRDWRGDNITNISVLASGWTLLGTYVDLTNWTDLEGAFLFEVEPGWFLDVSVSPQELSDRGFRSIASRKETTTHGGKVVDFVALDARPTAHLRGRATDDKGNPLASVEVNSAGVFLATEFGSFPTDNAGNFDIPIYGMPLLVRRAIFVWMSSTPTGNWKSP